MIVVVEASNILFRGSNLVGGGPVSAASMMKFPRCVRKCNIMIIIKSVRSAGRSKMSVVNPRVYGFV